MKYRSLGVRLLGKRMVVCILVLGVQTSDLIESNIRDLSDHENLLKRLQEIPIQKILRKNLILALVFF